MKKDDKTDLYTEYDKQADDFMKSTGTEIEIKFLKHGKHFVDDKDERDIYEVTLKRGTRKYIFPFGQSIAHSGKYTYFSSEKGQIVENDIKKLQKRVGRAVALGECRVNFEQCAPSPYSIFCGLGKYDVGSFEDFCSEFGYDIDSIKAHKIYDLVIKEYDELCKLYTDVELEKMQEIQ